MYYLQGGTPLLVFMPSQKELKELFNYDKKGYLVNKKNRLGGAKKGAKIGSLNGRGYLYARVNKKLLRVHRMIWTYFNGDIPEGMEIDHINHVTNDNRIENLRLVTHKENNRNNSLPKNNKSGCCGVSWDKKRNRWVANILSRKDKIYLGEFTSFRDAVRARKQAEVIHNFHPNHGR